MIGKVEKYTQEQLEEEEAYKARPQWFKFFYGAWLLSTSTLDDDQRGWYMQLLCYAASEGDPPGYLVDDEDELKEIAGFKELDSAVLFLLGKGVHLPGDVLNDCIDARQRKWNKVMKKFRHSEKHGGMLYNKRLQAALAEAYQLRRNAILGGKKLQEEIRNKRQSVENKLTSGSNADAEPEPSLKKNESGEVVNAREDSSLEVNVDNKLVSSGRSAGPKQVLSSRSAGAQRVLSHYISDLSSLVLETNEYSNFQETNTESKVGRNDTKTLEVSGDEESGEELTALELEPETGKRDVGKSVTGEMRTTVTGLRVEKTRSRRDWLPANFSLAPAQRVKLVTLITAELRCSNEEAELKNQIWFDEFTEYWSAQAEVDKESGRTGAQKANWYLTYRNRVEERCYREKQRRAGRNVQSKQKPWESTAERNARLEREAQEYTEQLQSGGERHHTNDSTIEPLEPS